jgi:hypothetical protein
MLPSYGKSTDASLRTTDHLATYGAGNNYKPKATLSVHGNRKLNVTLEINILPQRGVSYDILEHTLGNELSALSSFKVNVLFTPQTISAFFCTCFLPGLPMCFFYPYPGCDIAARFLVGLHCSDQTTASRRYFSAHI